MVPALFWFILSISPGTGQHDPRRRRRTARSWGGRPLFDRRRIMRSKDAPACGGGWYGRQATAVLIFTTAATEMSNVLTYATLLAIIRDIGDVLHTNADYLTRLDAAIGDGDHGRNMALGFQSVRK